MMLITLQHSPAGVPHQAGCPAPLMQEVAIMERVRLTSHDDVLSGIAHDLKTPLTAIRSFSQVLRDNPDLPDNERQRFLSIVLEESERLHQHIERMLKG
jgi:signal transduction histidine kinase